MSSCDTTVKTLTIYRYRITVEHPNSAVRSTYGWKLGCSWPFTANIIYRVSGKIKLEIKKKRKYPKCEKLHNITTILALLDIGIEPEDICWLSWNVARMFLVCSLHISVLVASQNRKYKKSLKFNKFIIFRYFCVLWL